MLRFTPLALLVLLAAPAAGQDRATTERRLEALRGQIQATERQVRQVQTEEAGALAAVEGIETEIRLREALVAEYAARLDSSRAETEALRGSIRRLEEEIAEARRSYRRRARHAYMRGRMSDLALILSAGSVSQALARARYLRRFAQARRRQIERIALRTEDLRAREASLEARQRETQRLLMASRSEASTLAERRQERGRLVAEVRRRRSALETELTQRRSDADALEGLVRDLVVEERRRAEEAERRAREEEERRVAAAAARRRAEEEARRIADARAGSVTRRRTPTPRTAARPAPAPPVAATPAPAPERPPAGAGAAPESRPVTLAGSFRSNRGRLPWPADGTLTGAFGTRTDPVFGTRIESPGIDLSTAPGAAVRAVFGGTVERVGVISSYGTYVMVSHGGYTTIYGNLSAVAVRQGQQVQPGQALARAGTAEQPRGAALFFALFEGDDPVDPSGWLVRR